MSEASEGEGSGGPLPELRLRPVPDGAQLPPHTAECMGCGPDAVQGYHLAVYRRGDRVVGRYTFDERHAGGPGVAHGGAVGVICDDLLGHALALAGVPAVTRRLEIDYRSPVLLGEPTELEAWLEGDEGRKLWLVGTGTSPEGVRRFTARGLFIRVGWEHFLAGLPADERERAEQALAEMRAEGSTEVFAW